MCLSTEFLTCTSVFIVNFDSLNLEIFSILITTKKISAKSSHSTRGSQKWPNTNKEGRHLFKMPIAGSGPRYAV